MKFWFLPWKKLKNFPPAAGLGTPPPSYSTAVDFWGNLGVLFSKNSIQLFTTDTCTWYAWMAMHSQFNHIIILYTVRIYIQLSAGCLQRGSVFCNIYHFTVKRYE